MWKPGFGKQMGNRILFAEAGYLGHARLSTDKAATTKKVLQMGRAPATTKKELQTGIAPSRFSSTKDMSVGNQSITWINSTANLDGSLRLACGGSFLLKDSLLKASSVTLYPGTVSVVANSSFSVQVEMICGSGGDGHVESTSISGPTIKMEGTNFTLFQSALNGSSSIAFQG